MCRRLCLPLMLALLLSSAPNRAIAEAPAEEPIYQGKTLSEWIGDLKDLEKRNSAAQALAVFGPKKVVVSALAVTLKDSKDSEFVTNAAQTLGKFGPKAKETLPALRAIFKAFEESNEESREYYKHVRQAIAEALVLIDDHPSPELAPALLVALETDDFYKRRDIVIRMGKFGTNAAKITVPALIDALRYEHAEIRVEAAKSLGRIGPAAKPAIHALTLALENAAPNKDEVWLGMWRKPDSNDAKINRPAYSGSYRDKAVLIACAEALGRIRPDVKGIVAAMRLALRDLDEDVCWAALCALLESDRDVSELTPILRKFLIGNDATYRRVALEILTRTGNDAKQTFSILIASLKDKKAELRARACVLLAYLGLAAKEAIPVLEKQSREDSEAQVRLAALTAMARIDSSRLKDTVRHLSAALHTESWDVAIECLIFLGPDAHDALPALRAMRSRKNYAETVWKIDRALEAIEKPTAKPTNR